MAIDPSDLKAEEDHLQDTLTMESGGIRPARKGAQPVRDLDAFLRSLPRFTPEEADELRQAIAAFREEQRRLTRKG